VQGLAHQHNLSLEELGDFDTLSDRIQTEVAASDTVVSFVPMVGPGLENRQANRRANLLFVAFNL